MEFASIKRVKSYIQLEAALFFWGYHTISLQTNIGPPNSIVLIGRGKTTSLKQRDTFEGHFL